MAALEQVCWHLTCCDFLFDVLEEAGVDMHQLAAGVEEARFHAERLFYDTARKRGRAVSVGSGAAVLLKRFEDQFEGDSPIVEDFVKGWPKCAAGGGDAGPCARPALYLGRGEWSAACENHATEAELDRYNQWRRDQEDVYKLATHMPDRRRRIGRALIDWWRAQSGPEDAFAAGMLG